MHETLEEVRGAMLLAYEREGTLSLSHWVTEYPRYRDDLLDYAFWLHQLSDSEDSGTMPTDDPWLDEGQVVHAVLKQLDRADSDRVVEQEELLLARRLKRTREKVESQRGRGTARAPFRRAAIQAWVVDILCEKRPQVSRYRTTKTLYLLEEALDLRLFTGHKKMAHGPYDPALRYKDAEPIAVEKGWYEVRHRTFRPGPSIEQAIRYAVRYVADPETARGFVVFLSSLRDSELETWSTVQMAVSELHGTNRQVSVSAIQDVIAQSKKWKSKLRKKHFGEGDIKLAITHLDRLGLLSSKD